jgi:hypothetical protein
MSVTHDIPGGWFGNDIGGGHTEGNVVVDAKRVARAVLWLRQRRYAILETEGVRCPNPEHVGVRIRYGRVTR